MTEQDARGQDSYQNSASSSGRFGYQSSGSQSAQRQQQTYTPQQQQPSTYSPTTTSANHATTAYARYGDVAGGTNQNQDSRNGYGYAPRSSVDTTALGNLAHASSLGQDSRHSTTGSRDGSSLQQLINYNRSQQIQAYDGSLAYGAGNATYGYGQQLAESREPATSRDNYSSRNQSQSQTPSQTQAPAQQQYSQYGTSAAYSNPTPAYAATSEVPQSSSYQANSDHQRQKTQPYYAQPVRPASGQSYRAGIPSSQFSPQASQSPTVSTYRASNANMGTSNLPSAYQTSRQQEQSRSSQSTQQKTYTEHGAPSATGQSADGRRDSSTPTTSKPSVQQPYKLVNDIGKHQQPTVARTDYEATKSLEEQIPKTVDPSHVFNHYEYQRRQAAAEAERARKAAEVEDLRKANEAAAALKRVSEGQMQPASNGAATDTGTKEKEEEMAAEMKLMIEKMRDYKSKDPSLFSQIWEQVKKTQPAGSTPTIPPLSAKDLTGPTLHQQSEVNGTALDTAGTDSSGANQSSNMLPDLGKFPAQRRKRAPYKKVGSAKKAKGSKTAVDASQDNTPISSPAIDPPPVGSKSQARQQVTPVHRSPYALTSTADREVVYVSGAGPPASPQTQTSTTGQSSELQPSVTVGPPSNGGTPTPAPSSGGTAWPEHKKWDLAMAAKNTLVASPINAARAKNITAEQILGFLNQNPSFEQLCQLIEAKGLIIERSHFARSLLGAIPDIGTSVRQRQQNALGSKQSPNVRQANGGYGMPQTDGSGHRVSSTNPSTVPQQMKENPQPNGVAPAAQMVAAETKGPSMHSPMDDKPAVPLTKQQMARKRNISDIVDLSQLSDDDLPPPPPKVLRLDEGTPVPADTIPTNGLEVDQAFRQPPLPIQHSQHVPFPYGPSPYFNPSQHGPVAYQTTPYRPLPPASYPIAAPPSVPSLTAPPPPLYSQQQRDLVDSELIVQPIDKSKAKKRKRYNPKTIVRDVLIAAGRHPTMEPLNYHLEPLRRNFRHVTDLSDLSTFNWDLVDPGGPPALGPVVVGVRPSGLTDGNDADDEGHDNSSQPAPVQMTSKHDSEGEPAVTVATTTDIPAVGSQAPKLLGPQRRRAPEKSEQPKAKVDKSWMSSGLNFGPKPSTPQTGPSGAISGTEDSNSAGVPKRGRPPMSAVQPSPPGVKRIGRPPGAKNKHPRKLSGTPKSAGIPARSRIDTTPAQSSGLRNTVAASADGIAIVVPSPSPSIAENKPRGRGRPRKSPKSSQQSTPIHRVYKCEWKDCPAELHNLETLKKHVIKHGDRYDGLFPCLWEGCGRPRQNDKQEEKNKASGEDPLDYATKEIWAKHMDRRHLAEYAWKLGDGPSLRSDSEVSDHVSDSAKRGGAPMISIAKGRPDPVPLSSGSKPAKLYHKTHGITTEQGKAEAFLEASEARRKSLGPGVDRTGATFVTKQKNELLDDSLTPLEKVQQDDDV
ncbi:MAG: hypothetical protein Q9169_002884 [Polycauliona sp. 2 TL-2023]